MTVTYLVPALIGFGVTCTAALILALGLFLGRYGFKCGCLWCKQKWRDREMLSTCRKGRFNSTNPICSNERCPVCLDDFESGEDIVVTPCSHGFHKGCLLECLQTSPYCPLCKVKIFTDDAEYSTLIFRGPSHYYPSS